MNLQIDIPGEASRTITLSNRAFVIGSASNAHVRIERADIPAALCQVHPRSDGTCAIRAAASHAGAIAIDQGLQPGQPFRLGPVTFVLLAGPPRPGWRCPSCSASLPGWAVLCTQCGYDHRAGRRIGPHVLPVGLTPPPVSDAVAAAPPAMVFQRKSDAGVVSWFEVGAPTVAIIVALAALGAFVAQVPASDLFHTLMRIGLTYLLNMVGLVASVLIASHWGAVEFGSVQRGLLKCSAVVLLTLAATAWAGPLVTNVIFAGLPPGARALTIATIALSIGVQIALPVVLLKLFFQLDMVELMILAGTQFFVNYGTFVLIGLLL